MIPTACLNAWQTDSYRRNIGYIYRSWDWIERGIFIGLTLMLAYTAFLLIRFLFRYHLLVVESRYCGARTFHEVDRSKRVLVADLSPGLATLKGIASTAPLLGLAGTSYGILAELSRGFAMSKSSVLKLLALGTAASLVTASVGILVAIAATFAHNFIGTRIEALGQRRLARRNSSGSQLGLFHFAQTLPLKKRFSGQHFSIVAAPALARVVALFMPFHPYQIPIGLRARLLPFGAVDRSHLSKPVVVSIFTIANGSVMIQVNSENIPEDNFEEAVSHKLRGMSERRVHVKADSRVFWSDVAEVMDRLKGLQCEVVLVTGTPL